MLDTQGNNKRFVILIGKFAYVYRSAASHDLSKAAEHFRPGPPPGLVLEGRKAYTQ